MLPADIRPRPVHASGMMRLARTFNRPAIKLKKTTTPFAEASFSFGLDGKLPTSSIDTFRGGEIVRVISRANQMSVSPSQDWTSDVTFGPKFGSLTTGAHRAMWFEGDCRVDNLAVPLQVYFMLAGGIGGFGIKASDMTIMQVVQVHNSVFTNQISGVYRGCTFSFASPGDGNGRHTRLFQESNTPSNPTATGGGGFAFEDEAATHFSTFNAWADTTPVILTFISGAAGTFFGQNEDFRSVPTHTGSTRIATQVRLGCHEDSVSNPQQNNEAAGMSEIATLFWNKALTLKEAAVIRSALYDVMGIDWRHSHSNAPLVLVLTDSIYAGYKADDLRGWDKIAAQAMPSHVRWANCASPGQGIIQNTTGAVPADYHNTYTLGLFPGWISQVIRQHRKRVHVVWGTPLNDMGNQTPAPTAQYVYDNGTLKLIDLVRAADPTATITLCTATHSSNPTFEAFWAAGTPLIRDGGPVHGYNVVDLWVDPFLSVVNAPDTPGAYKDGGHLTNAGCAKVAELILPTLNSWLAALP